MWLLYYQAFAVKFVFVMCCRMGRALPGTGLCLACKRNTYPLVASLGFAGLRAECQRSLLHRGWGRPGWTRNTEARFLHLQLVLQAGEMLRHSGYEKRQGGAVHETLPVLFIC